jgi:hypothetical protein
VTEDDVAIGYDGARALLCSAGNDNGMDPVRREDARNSAQRRVGTAGDDARVHRVSYRLLLLWWRGHRILDSGATNLSPREHANRAMRGARPAAVARGGAGTMRGIWRWNSM